MPLRINSAPLPATDRVSEVEPDEPTLGRSIVPPHAGALPLLRHEVDENPKARPRVQLETPRSLQQRIESLMPMAAVVAVNLATDVAASKIFGATPIVQALTTVVGIEIGKAFTSGVGESAGKSVENHLRPLIGAAPAVAIGNALATGFAKRIAGLLEGKMERASVPGKKKFEQLPHEIILEIANKDPVASSKLGAINRNLRAIAQESSTWGHISRRADSLKARAIEFADQATQAQAMGQLLQPILAFGGRPAAIVAGAFHRMNPAPSLELPIKDIVGLLGSPPDRVTQEGGSGAYGIRSAPLRQASLAKIEEVLKAFEIRDFKINDERKLVVEDIVLTGNAALEPGDALTALARYSKSADEVLGRSPDEEGFGGSGRLGNSVAHRATARSVQDAMALATLLQSLFARSQ